MTPYLLGMDTQDFDKALISAVFHQAGLVGWRGTTLVAAAREAGLDQGRVRVRFPGKTAVLLRFGSMADRAMLETAPSTGTRRERLFDLVMARFDQLQAHRAGMLALFMALRTDPATALLLYGATLRSMKWMLDAADVPSSGAKGALRVHGLAVVWAYTLRAWEKDESADMSATMAALDRALDRAVQAEDMLPCSRRAVQAEPGPEPIQGAEDAAPVV